jgi:hypothetical protein
MYCNVYTVAGSVVYILRTWISPKHRLNNQLLFTFLDFFMHPFWSLTTMLLWGVHKFSRRYMTWILLRCTWASNGFDTQMDPECFHLLTEGRWYLSLVFTVFVLHLQTVKAPCQVLVHHCKVFRTQIVGIFWPSCFPILCHSLYFGDLFCCYYRMLHSVRCDQSFAVYPWHVWIMLPFVTPCWKPTFLHLGFIWWLTIFRPVFVEWRSLLIQGIEYFRNVSYLDCTRRVYWLFCLFCVCDLQSWQYLYPLKLLSSLVSLLRSAVAFVRLFSYGVFFLYGWDVCLVVQ